MSTAETGLARADLDGRRWDDLAFLVRGEVAHNGSPLVLPGSRAMLERDVRAPRSAVDVLVGEPPRVAARLPFDCRPAGMFPGLDVRGRRVRFAGNALYGSEDGLIREVWSAIDRAAVEAQLR